MESIDLNKDIEKTNRLGLCDVCQSKKSKYTCPRCEIKTCSLPCSRIHKNELECDGIREKTKYKPLKQMTTMDFMNDYYFLEEASRFTKDIKYNKTVKNQARLNLRVIKLRKEAQKRNIRLYLLNNGLTKRKKNQSMFKGQEQTIYWHVELVFPMCFPSINLSKKFNENTKIHEILRTMLHEVETNPHNAKQLDFYRAESVQNLRVFLKAEGLKKSNKRYYEMDKEKSLRTNLSGKILIEYPTLHIVFNHSADDYDLIASDDESVETEMKKFSRTLHEEVFSKKVGINPPLLLKPEEVPIVSEVINDFGQSKPIIHDNPNVEQLHQNLHVESDDEVSPENYFFSNNF